MRRAIPLAAFALAGQIAVPASAKVYACRSDQGAAEHRVEVKGERFALASVKGWRILCGPKAASGACEAGKARRSWADGPDGERILFSGRRGARELQIYDPASDTTAYFACTRMGRSRGRS